MARFRKGDRVQLDGIVAHDFDDAKPGEAGVHIDLIGDNNCRPIVGSKHVKLVFPMFAPGDAVKWPSGTGEQKRGRVVAVAGDGIDALLWVRVDQSHRMETVDAVICERLDTLPAILRGDPLGWEPYTVQSGDTLGALANRYGASIEEIVRRNNIPNPDHLAAGDTILLPPMLPF